MIDEFMIMDGTRADAFVEYRKTSANWAASTHRARSQWQTSSRALGQGSTA